MNFSETEVNTLLIPFLETFRKHTITVVDSEEYEFDKLIPIFLMLSKASSVEKAIVNKFKIFKEYISIF